MHKERGRPQPGEMPCAHLGWPSRRMEGIRQQQQSAQPLQFVLMIALDNRRLRAGNQHRCLSATIRVPTEEDAAGHTLSYRVDRLPQPLSVTLSRGGKRWPVRACLAEGQVAAQHRNPGLGKRIGDCCQKLGLAIRPSAMGEHQRVAIFPDGKMKKAPNRRVGGEIGKRLYMAL